MPSLVVIGAVTLHSVTVEVGALPRAIGVSANALSLEPVQTFDYISGFLPIAVSGMFKPPNAEAERAALQTEVNKATNTVTVDGVAYRVFKNDGFAFNYELHSSVTGLIYYSVTLNCLP
jgi:thiamine transporter ThiT